MGFNSGFKGLTGSLKG